MGEDQENDSEDEPLIKKTASRSQRKKRSIKSDDEDVPISLKRTKHRLANLGSMSNTSHDESSRSSQENGSRPVRSAARAAVKSISDQITEPSESQKTFGQSSKKYLNPRNLKTRYSSEEASTDEYGSSNKRQRVRKSENNNQHLNHRETGTSRKENSLQSDSDYSDS